MSPFGNQKGSQTGGPKYKKVNSAEKKTDSSKKSPPPQAQNVTKHKIFVFGAGNNDVKDVENGAIELNEMRSRKDKDNWGVDGVEELKKNHYIDHDICAEDSLPKLALRFGCTITQLKQANGMYNNQELFAYKTLKIPVFSHSIIWDTYRKKRNSLDRNPSGSKSEPTDRMKRSYSDPDMNHARIDFSVEGESSTRDFVTTDYSYSDEEYDFENSEQRNLLNSRTRVSTTLNDTNNAYEEYLETVDKDIQKISHKVQSKNDVDITRHSIAYMQPLAADKKSTTDKLGHIGYVNFKGILICFCVVGVLIPLCYILYFKVFNKRS